MEKQTDKAYLYQTGLVLSGGSVRGFAHLGVLQAMEEAGISPDVISGASAGAIVGAFYADGYPPAEILEMFIEKRLFHLVHLKMNRRGFLRPSGVDSLLRKYLRARTFEHLRLPLFIAASDMNRGIPVYFKEGSLTDRIMASAAIPVLFQPVVIDGTTYVDGGLLDNLPVFPVRKDSRIIIGVSVNPNYEENDLGSFLKLTERTIYLNLVSRIHEHSRKCDVFIEPLELRDYGLFEISKAREVYDIGYREAKRVLKENARIFTRV